MVRALQRSILGRKAGASLISSRTQPMPRLPRSTASVSPTGPAPTITTCVSAMTSPCRLPAGPRFSASHGHERALHIVIWGHNGSRHGSRQERENSMAKPVRRVVTGHDASGKAVVLMDGAAPNQKLRNTGLVSTLMWATDETPADISGTRDRAARESGVAPPGAGSILRVVDFPPLSAEAAAALDQSAIHREMGLGTESHGAP